MWGSRYTSGSVTTVEAAKIAAQTTTAVGLPHHVKRAGPGRGGLLDDHVLLQLIKFCLGRLQLLAIKFAKLGSYWQPLGFELMSSSSGPN
jgi:hypothetical protein